MTEYSKHFKRLLRELSAEAYEKELSLELDMSFKEWRDGKINTAELSDRVHQYEIGSSRELYKKYNDGENDLNVAYTIVTGMIDQKGIPKELMEAIDMHIRFYESLKDAGELRFPGE